MSAELPKYPCRCTFEACYCYGIADVTVPDQDEPLYDICGCCMAECPDVHGDERASEVRDAIVWQPWLGTDTDL